MPAAKRGGLNLRQLTTSKDTSGKYANAAYPLWMRTLEDKYQKLHQKIAFSTRLNGIRTRRNVRSGKEESSSRQTNVSVISDRFPSQFDVTDSEDFRGNYLSENLKIKEGVVYEKKKNGEPDNVGGVKIGDLNDNLVCQEDVAENCEEVKKQEGNVDNGDCNLKKQTTSLSEGHPSVKQDSMYKFNKESTERNVLSRYSKYAANAGNAGSGRGRHYTSRSCPAMIETLRQMGAPPSRESRNYPRYPRGFKTLNMFSKMSTEAQHAVSETLLEMVKERSNSNTPESSVRDISPSKQSLLHNTNNKCPKIYVKHKRVAENKLIRTERMHHPKSDDSVCSSDSTELSDRVRIPHLNNSTVGVPRLPKICCVDNTRPFLPRLPGMGNKNDLARFRESTFQITPPDFDIRYRDVLPTERSNFETPPLEIKKEAIRKCQEWLAKYTNR